LTETGFSLNDLVEIEVQRLCGLSYSRRYKKPLPTYAVYQDVMELLTPGEIDSEVQADLKRRYKEKIIGKTCLVTAPSEYWTIGAIWERGMTFHQWNAYTIEEKAKTLARMYVKSMIEVIDAHYDEEDDQKKREAEKDKKKGGRTIKGQEKGGEEE
jgi:hypothetical protein